MKNSLIWIVILIASNNFYLNGQEIQGVDLSKIVPPTPNSASLGVYGDIPISLYTGTPNVTIPIWTLSGRELQIPISLSYNASGIKVNEQASWVGMGWSLNAGGVITRTVRGRKDDLINPILQKRKSPPFTVSDFNSNLLIDSEPDIFFYNVNGMSGEFVLDENGTPFYRDYKDMIVKVDDENFTLITDNGTTYIFTQTESTIVGGVNSVSGWLLSKIISPSGKETADFFYTHEFYRHANIDFAPVLLEASFSPLTQGFNKNNRITYNGKRLTSIKLSTGKKIEFIANTVRTDLAFTVQGNSSNPRLLDEIHIYENIDKALPTSVFKFSITQIESIENFPNFPSDVNNIDDTAHTKYRPFLQNIREFSGDTLTSKPPYQFTYYSPEKLPYKISSAQDHWGYYNGKNFNSTLIPDYNGPYALGDNKFTPFNDMATSFSSSSCANFPYSSSSSLTVSYSAGSDRLPRFPEMQYGSLKSITYPTGGQLEFIYEPHSYSLLGSEFYNDYVEDIQTNPDSIDHIAGGLRIAEQKLWDDGELKRHLTYKYIRSDFNNNSSGVLYRFPFYASYTWYDNNLGESFFPYCESLGNSSNIRLKLKLASASKVTFGASQGPHIGYKEVRVEEAGNGFTTHKFYTSSDNNANEVAKLDLTYLFDNGGIYENFSIEADYPLWPFPPFETRNWKRGMLKEKQIISESNFPIYKEEFDYEFEELDTLKAATIIIERPDIDGWWSTYQYIQGWAYLSEKITTNYSQEGSSSLGIRNIYRYDGLRHKFITKDSVINSDNTQYTTNFYYPGDPDPDHGAIYLGPPEMWDTASSNFKHIISQPIKTINQTANLKTGKSILSYSYDNIDSMVLLNSYTVYPSGIGDSIRTSYFYNPTGSIVRAKRDDDQSSSFIYGYNSYLPTASIVNAVAGEDYLDETEVAYTSFEIMDTSKIENGGWSINVSMITEDTTITGVITGTAILKRQLLSVTGNITVNFTVVQNPPSGSLDTIIIRRMDGTGTDELIIIDSNTTSKSSSQLSSGDYYFIKNSKPFAVVVEFEYTNVIYNVPGFDTDESPKTGLRALKLLTGNKIEKSNLVLGNYILSYWQKLGSVQANISGSGSITYTETYDIGTDDWQLVVHTVNINAASEVISINGTNILIDELRLHPIDAEMTTYAYNKRNQVINVGDPNNVIATYNYDELGRLVTVKDQDYNILQQTQYNYRNSTP